MEGAAASCLQYASRGDCWLESVFCPEDHETDIPWNTLIGPSPTANQQLPITPPSSSGAAQSLSWLSGDGLHQRALLNVPLEGTRTGLTEKSRARLHHYLSSDHMTPPTHAPRRGLEIYPRIFLRPNGHDADINRHCWVCSECT